jgi:hypothetical protein
MSGLMPGFGAAWTAHPADDGLFLGMGGDELAFDLELLGQGALLVAVGTALARMRTLRVER